MENENNAGPEMSPEQAADLARLQAGADAQTVALSPEVEAEDGPDLAGELAALVSAFVAMAAPILPSLQRVYTPETTQTAAAAVAAVCDKHGWAQGGLMGEWGVEISAAVVLVPLAIATAQGVKADIAENNRKTKLAEGPGLSLVVNNAKTEAPGQNKGVVIGTVLPDGGGSANS